MWNARLLPDASIMENAQMHSGISSLNPIVNKQKHNDLFAFPEQPHPLSRRLHLNNLPKGERANIQTKNTRPSTYQYF